MKINVLTQLREVIETALSGQTNLRKSFRNFFIGTMILHIVMRGRINYTSMARVGDSCESRFRQNYRRVFDWLGYNIQFAAGMLAQRIAIAIDPSYIDKSGKKTPGLSYFWSGCAKMAKWGLEILGIAVVNADTKEAVHLKAVQTFKGRSRKGRKPAFFKYLKKSDGLIGRYLEALYKEAKRLLEITHLIVADSYFANGPFVKGLDTMGFDLISRLHDNAKMRYLYTGPKHQGKGRPRKFAGRVDLDNLSPEVFSCEMAEGDNGKPVVMHVGEVWVDCLDRTCKVVIVDFLDPDKKRQTRKVYFSTDRTLAGRDIFDLYRTRFQIEFLYRSGKGLTGLTHCQARNEQALDFAFNMSLSSINVMRHFAAMYGYDHLSDASIKMLAHNAFMLERFISISGDPPKLRKNDTAFKELLFYGVRDAA